MSASEVASVAPRSRPSLDVAVGLLEMGQPADLEAALCHRVIGGAHTPRTLLEATTACAIL